MQVIFSSTAMNLETGKNSILETECLFGEEVLLLDNYNEWVYYRLLTDNYSRWVKNDNLGYFRSLTHKVLSFRSGVFTSDN